MGYYVKFLHIKGKNLRLEQAGSPIAKIPLACELVLRTASVYEIIFPV